MKKSGRRYVLYYGLVILMFLGVFSLAEDIRVIRKGDVLPKSQFVACTDINNEGEINGDLYSACKLVTSIGKIKGDLVAGAQSVRSSGEVDGDVLAVGRDVDISGVVRGNIRGGGSNVVIGGDIGKNITIFANHAAIKSDSKVNGNILVAGEYIKIEGQIKGYTKIIGNRVTLGGEFFGDVDINLEIPDTIDSKHRKDKMSEGSVTILSGTVIHGKLTYKSSKEAIIETGAQVKSQEWIERKEASKVSQLPGIAETSWSFFKMLLSTVAFFLVAMLLYKLLPVSFKRQGELIAQKPYLSVGLGLLGIASIVATLIVLIILILLSFIFSAPMLSVVFALVGIVFYVLLFYFSFIPVSMWAGNYILKDRYNVPVRFATGLVSISISLFILGYLAPIPVLGPLFGLIAFVVGLTVFLAGIGAILMTIKDWIDSGKKRNVLDSENVQGNQ